jgi:hypothetical protein
MVSIILGMGLKIYFTNQTAMYRLYSISNKVNWLEPFIQTSTFFILYFGLKFVPLAEVVWLFRPPLGCYKLSA